MAREAENDFRESRKLLPPEAFAYAKGPDLAPSDLIPKDVWYSIMSLPDDVSLRTSADHGTELKHMHELWSSIIDSFGNNDALSHSVIYVTDELMACIVNSLLGFYRVAASCLRSALELATHGAYYQRCKDLDAYKDWEKNQEDVNFGRACNNLNGLDDVKSLNDYLYSKMKDTLFEQKNSRYTDYPGGWARKLHSQLSNFVHSKPAYSNFALWEGSNGPIYVPQSFGRICAMFCDTMALTFILIKISRPTFALPKKAISVFNFPNVRPSKVAVYTYRYLWPK